MDYVASPLTLKIKKAQGCLVAAVAGDSLGMPTEYISQAQLHQYYGGRVSEFVRPIPSHPCGHLREGQYTDDGQVLILLAASVAEKSGFDSYDFGQRLGQWAYNCTTIPGVDRFAGTASVLSGLRLFHGETPTSAQKWSDSCGSVTRSPALGIFYHRQQSALTEIAKHASKITHAHPAAVDATVFFTQLIAAFMNDAPINDAIQYARSLLTSDLQANIGYVLAHKDDDPLSVAATLGASESCYQAVPMALHCFLHSPEDLEATLLAAANLVPGDTDSIACIAGALSGAYNGADRIPHRFMEKLEDRQLLESLGKRLVEVAYEH